jgi:hypothetical protein
MEVFGNKPTIAGVGAVASNGGLLETDQPSLGLALLPPWRSFGNRPTIAGIGAVASNGGLVVLCCVVSLLWKVVSKETAFGGGEHHTNGTTRVDKEDGVPTNALARGLRRAEQGR